MRVPSLAVTGGGPRASGHVLLGVVAAEHRLLLEQHALARVHVVVEHRRGRDHRRVAVAHHMGVELGRPTARGGDLLGLLDEVLVAGGELPHADAADAVGPLEQHEVVGVDVDAAELHAGAMRHDLGPVVAAGRGDGRLHELEVLGAVGVGDHEEATGVVLDAVLDVLLARLHHRELALRVVGVEEPHLVGDLGADVHDDVRVVLGGADAQVEALVVLLEHEHVVVGRRAEGVAPELVGPHGVVGLHVEERAVVERPGRAIVGARHEVGQVLASREIAEAEVVELGTGSVGRPREQAPVGGDVEGPEGEELAVARLDVLVEEHGLGGRAGRRVGGVGVGHRLAAVDRVLLALLGAGVVPPAAPPHRHRQVGLLDARLDLLEQLLLERLGVGELRLGPGVLGLEVGDGVGVVLVAQPGVLVDDGVAVVLARGRDLLGDRGPLRVGHAGSLRSTPCRSTRWASSSPPSTRPPSSTPTP
jgi:hypothetical protein